MPQYEVFQLSCTGGHRLFSQEGHGMKRVHPAGVIGKSYLRWMPILGIHKMKHQHKTKGQRCYNIFEVSTARGKLKRER